MDSNRLVSRPDVVSLSGHMLAPCAVVDTVPYLFDGVKPSDVGEPQYIIMKDTSLGIIDVAFD